MLRNKGIYISRTIESPTIYMLTTIQDFIQSHEMMHLPFPYESTDFEEAPVTRPTLQRSQQNESSAFHQSFNLPVSSCPSFTRTCVVVCQVSTLVSPFKSHLRRTRLSVSGFYSPAMIYSHLLPLPCRCGSKSPTYIFFLGPRSPRSQRLWSPD